MPVTAQSEKAGSLALFMPGQLTFEEFIERLASIDHIYLELCQILDISTTDEPLQISKIESGGLWASLSGNSKVLSLMDDLIRGTARFMHRNYT